MKRNANGSRMPGAGSRILLLGLFVFAALAPASAQHEQHGAPTKLDRRPTTGNRQPEPKAPDRVAGYEPMRCWRQISAGAVAIGESFKLVLTCAVYDAENAQVIPDESRLNVASIQVQPFEIIGGTHPPDVRRGPRRFLQYEYQLRIINPDVIGHDINIPPLTISYRIHSRVGAAASVEGRDLSYLLPMMPIKVLALVPLDASDIRDASDASLGAVESLRVRSTLFRVLTILFGALAAALAILAFVPLARSKAPAASADRDRIGAGAVARRAAEELKELQSRGWDDETIGRALGALRLIGAAAIGRAISQKSASGTPPEGRLIVKHGLVRPVPIAISSSITADDVARAMADPDASWSTTHRQQLETLQSALSTFTAALYGQANNRDSASLDDGARQAIAMAAGIKSQRRAR